MKYLIEYKEFNNTESMNESLKNWLAAFILLVNLGIVPQNVMASSNKVKIDYIQHNIDRAILIDNIIKTLEIIYVTLFIGGVLLYFGKRHIELKNLRKKSIGFLKEIDDLIKQLDSELNNPDDLEYLRNVKLEFEKYMGKLSITKTPTNESYLIDKLEKHSDKLKYLIRKANKFNYHHDIALEKNKYLEEAEKYLKLIDTLEKELSEYQIKSTNEIDKDELKSISDTIEKNIGNKDIYASVSTLLDNLSTIKNSYEELKTINQNIPMMEEELFSYEDTIEKWIKDLEKYDSMDYEVEKVYKLKEELDELVKSERSTIEKYNKYIKIKNYVKDVIDEEEREEEMRKNE